MTKPKTKRLRHPGSPFRAECEAILGRFGDARCVLECAVRSLEQRGEQQGLGPGEESVCLRHGLELLRAAYNALDLALLKLP